MANQRTKQKRKALRKTSLAKAQGPSGKSASIVGRGKPRSERRSA